MIHDIQYRVPVIYEYDRAVVFDTNQSTTVLLLSCNKYHSALYIIRGLSLPRHDR